MKRILSRDEEIEIAICYLGGVPIKKITDHYDINRMTVHRVISRLGIPAERGKRAAS